MSCEICLFTLLLRYFRKLIPLKTGNRQFCAQSSDVFESLWFPDKTQGITVWPIVECTTPHKITTIKEI